MAIDFKNRKGDNYYIKQRKTKTGKTTYTMTKTKSKDCISEVPSGYEVHERPENGIMVIRKRIASKFTLKELHIIKKILQENDTITDFKIDIKGNELTIYTSELKRDGLFEKLFPFMKNEGMQMLGMISNYTAMMKVIAIEEETPKKYGIQRYCFRGSIDDWITIGMSNQLKELVKKYSYHLGKESFYELSYNFGE